MNLQTLLDQQQHLEYPEFMMRLLALVPLSEQNHPAVTEIFKAHILRLADDYDCLVAKEDQLLRRVDGYSPNIEMSIRISYLNSLCSLFPVVGNYLIHMNAWDHNTLTALKKLMTHKQSSLYDRLAVAVIYLNGHPDNVDLDVLGDLYRDISQMNIVAEWNYFKNYESFYALNNTPFELSNIFELLPIENLQLAQWMDNQILYFYVYRRLKNKYKTQNFQNNTAICEQLICALCSINDQIKSKTMMGQLSQLEMTECVLELFEYWSPNMLQRIKIINALEDLSSILQRQNYLNLYEQADQLHQDWLKHLSSS